MKVRLLVLMEALVEQGKRLVLILVKQTQNCAQFSIIILIIVTCLLMEIFMFKADNKNVNFPTFAVLSS